MLLLLLDQLRRHALVYLGSIAFTALIWALPPGAFSAQWVVAWSLAVAYVAGPGLWFRSMGVRQKELVLLPVSWQGRWRAQWMQVVIVPLAVTALGQLLGLGIAAVSHLSRGNPEAIVLSVLCDAAYVGFSAALLGILGRARSPRGARNWPANRRSVIVRIVIRVLAVFALVLLGGLSGAVWFRFLPPDIAALRGVTGVVIAGGICTGVWTWFSWSALGPRTAAFARIPNAAATAPSIPMPEDSRGVVGRTVLVQVAVKRAVIRAAVLGALIAPFLWLPSRDAVKVGWVILTFVAGGTFDWPPKLRQLRLLPITTANLNLALLSGPVTLWATTALLMRGAAFVAPSRFDMFPTLAFVSVLMGLNTLNDSVVLRRSTVDRILFFGAMLGTAYGLPRLQRVAPFPLWPAVGWVGGIGLLAAAAILNYRTLSRSSTAYRDRAAVAFPFGVPQPR